MLYHWLYRYYVVSLCANAAKCEHLNIIKMWAIQTQNAGMVRISNFKRVGDVLFQLSLSITRFGCTWPPTKSCIVIKGSVTLSVNYVLISVVRLWFHWYKHGWASGYLPSNQPILLCTLNSTRNSTHTLIEQAHNMFAHQLPIDSFPSHNIFGSL